MKIRVTCNFVGRLSGALGVCYRINEVRRTIEVPDQFTMDEAVEAARVALYSPDPVYTETYERVSNLRLGFN